MQLNKSHVFVLLLVILAFIATYISFQRIPHPLVLHINDHWHIMLIGETRESGLEYRRDDFMLSDSNSANLWLNGSGSIVWQQLQIEVQPTTLIINGKSISTSTDKSQAHLMLYPDGRISKGRFALQH